MRPRRTGAQTFAALLSNAHAAVARRVATARVGERVTRLFRPPGSIVPVLSRLPRRLRGFHTASFGGGILIGVLAIQFFGAREPIQPPAAARTPSVPSAAERPSLAASSSPDVVPASITGETKGDPGAVTVSRSAETRRTDGRVAATNYRGGLRIDSRPAGAAVFVNNKQVGHTPIVLSSLEAGSRAIRIQLNGYAPWSRAVRVVANQQATVSAQLAPAQ